MLINKTKRNRGMTVIEIIVVLSIFSVLSGVAIFNYSAFQSKVDIKNLATDIALKIIEAQKASSSGKLPSVAQEATWKPSYGVYFNLAVNPSVDNKSFIYFTDLSGRNGQYDPSSCPGTGECLEKITIAPKGGYYISNLDVFYIGNPTSVSLNDLTVTFTRPSSSANIKSSGISTTPPPTDISYVQIKIKSPKEVTNLIKIYPSGRVQIN